MMPTVFEMITPTVFELITMLAVLGLGFVLGRMWEFGSRNSSAGS